MREIVAKRIGEVVKKLCVEANTNLSEDVAEAIKKAQGTLKYALIGFILFVSAFLIMTIIQTLFLGGTQNGTGKPNLFEFKIGQ